MRASSCRSRILVLGAILALPAPALGQDPPPPPPDTVPPVDSIPVDTTAQAPAPTLDSLQTDSLVAEAAARAAALADSVTRVRRNLPELGRSPRAGWKTGLRSWDHGEIMASGAATLAELLAEVPGLLVTLHGDYGTPAGATAFGTGGGGLRVFRDGFELYPFAGGAPNLSRLGLAGIGRVRIDRGVGGVRVDLQSVRNERSRSLSLIEVGTGELDTNLFRGVLAAPRALGGSLGVALERTDTRGPGGNEPGNVSGSWFRYQWQPSEAWGVAVDYRSASSETKVSPFPSKVGRTDWVVRARKRTGGGLTGELYAGRSSHSLGEPSDTAGIGSGILVEGGDRFQLGARAEYSAAAGWARGEYRRFDGGGLPAWRLDGTVGYDRPDLGGVEARFETAGWPEGEPKAFGARAWSAPLAGIVSLFASWEEGAFGNRIGVLREIVSGGDTVARDTLEGPRHGIQERRGRRAGARIGWRGAVVSGAWLGASADTVFPIEFVADPSASPVPEWAERTGWEALASLPVPGARGLRLEASYQSWDAPAVYLPERMYGGALAFHRAYLESGNFEWWWRVGVRGHSEVMLPRLEGPDGNGARLLARAPSFQYWYARTQARILTVRIFVRWDNLLGNEELRYPPGPPLPTWRTVFGIRWTMFS